MSPVTGTASVNFGTSQRLAALTIGNGGIVTLTPPGVPAETGDMSAPSAFSEDIAAAMSDPASGAQTVPEPTGVVLVSLSIATLLARRMRK